jgi:hypothetical protein
MAEKMAAEKVERSVATKEIDKAHECGNFLR